MQRGAVTPATPEDRRRDRGEDEDSEGGGRAVHREWRRPYGIPPLTRTPETTILVNPASSNGRTGRHWPTLEPLVLAKLGECTVRFSEGPGDLIALARRAVADGAERIIAVGGDGSLNEVVNGVGAGSPVAVGILPSGTGSDFRRMVGIPNQIEEALERIAVGGTRAIDLGRVEFATEDGSTQERYFINVADFGIGGKIAERVNRGSKFLGGKATFYLQTIRSLLDFRNPVVQLTADGGAPQEQRIKTVAVANAKWFGGGMGVAPDAEIDDGLLDLVVFGDLGKLESVKRLQETYRCRPIVDPRVRYARVHSLKAESEETVLLELDGEVVGKLPATFTVLPAALTFCVAG